MRNGFAPCRRASSERSVACCERPTEPLRTHGRSHSCRWRRWSLGPWASSTVRRHGTTPCPAFPCVTLLSLACPYVALGALWPAGAKGGFGSACLPRRTTGRERARARQATGNKYRNCTGIHLCTPRHCASVAQGHPVSPKAFPHTGAHSVNEWQPFAWRSRRCQSRTARVPNRRFERR